MKTKLVTILSAALLFTGCSVFKVHVPNTTVSIQPKNGGIEVTSPKDGVLTGLDITFTQSPSNSNYHVSVQSLSYILNPTNILATGSAQADLIRAHGEATVNVLNAAGNLAGQVAAQTIKQAAK